MFKPSHYYVIIHKDFNTTRPIKCLIKANRCSNSISSAWSITIIKIFESDPVNSFTKGLTTIWFENWCEIKKEFEKKPTNAEILAHVI